MKFKHLGHSAIYIAPDNTQYGILIDPYCEFDPTKMPLTDIFVTHAHIDHSGNAVNISKATGATVTAIFETANYMEKQGAKVQRVSMGGKLKFPWGFAKFLPAFHSSSFPDGSYGGSAASLLLKVDDKIIYHAGDTCLNQEMKTVKELYEVDYAFLPIGGVFTMDVEEALIAAQWLGAKTVIPIHYNSFDAIKIEDKELKRFEEGLLAQGRSGFAPE